MLWIINRACLLKAQNSIPAYLLHTLKAPLDLLDHSGRAVGTAAWTCYRAFSCSRLYSQLFRSLIFFLIYLFILIGGLLLFNIVVVFAIHRHESAMDAHVSPILNPPPSTLPTLSAALSALLHALNLHWSSILHMVIYISMLFCHIILPLPSPT